MRDVSLRKRISDRIGIDSKRIMLEFGLALLAVLALSSVTQAATGDLVGNVTFSHDCGVGVGITYDGTNLWYSCDGVVPNLFRADPMTGNVSANYTVPTSELGSLAYDAVRNVIWAAGDGGNIFMVQLDAGKNVMNTTLAFNTGIAAGLVDGLGFDATVTPNQLYWSPDSSTKIYVFNVTGTPVRNFTWTGTGCYNSGVAIGGDLLFQGSDGCDHVWVVNNSPYAKSIK